MLRARNRRPLRLSLKARQQKELEAAIKAIIALILALFGIRANFDFEDKKDGEHYYQLLSDWMTLPRAEQEQELAQMWDEDLALAR